MSPVSSRHKDRGLGFAQAQGHPFADATVGAGDHRETATEVRGGALESAGWQNLFLGNFLQKQKKHMV